MNTYTRHKPFIASIKNCYSLSKAGSTKDTRHIVVDISGSGMKYDVGDCLAVLPENPPQMVEKMLEALKATGEEQIITRHNPSQESLKEILEKRVNLSSLPKKVVELVADKYPTLKHLLAPENRQAFKDFAEQREVWDFLLEHPVDGLPMIVLLDALQALLPRFYSIASCQPTVGDEVHLTVTQIKYTTSGYPRWGICTHYLCEIAPEKQWTVPVYLQPNKGFTLPENPSSDIIMIGPGTGVAPYRGFMQKRIWRGDTGRNWLFFGERNRTTEYYYENEWLTWQTEGKLIVDTAFSRDQEQKIYVQHKLHEHAKEVFQWLEQGAYLFLCGDATHMAKDVEAALLNIICEQGQMNEAQAAEYLKAMRLSKRYLKDVY